LPDHFQLLERAVHGTGDRALLDTDQPFCQKRVVENRGLLKESLNTYSVFLIQRDPHILQRYVGEEYSFGSFACGERILPVGKRLEKASMNVKGDSLIRALHFDSGPRRPARHYIFD